MNCTHRHLFQQRVKELYLHIVGEPLDIADQRPLIYVFCNLDFFAPLNTQDSNFRQAYVLTLEGAVYANKYIEDPIKKMFRREVLDCHNDADAIRTAIKDMDFMHEWAIDEARIIELRNNNEDPFENENV
jgi:hypothetical protein